MWSQAWRSVASLRGHSQRWWSMKGLVSVEEAHLVEVHLACLPSSVREGLRPLAAVPGLARRGAGCRSLLVASCSLPGSDAPRRRAALLREPRAPWSGW